MNKNELILAVASKTGLPKKAVADAVNATLEVISDSVVTGDKVQLVGFGTFEAKNRPARKGLNPRTKEIIEIPAARTPSFKAGKAFKEKML